MKHWQKLWNIFNVNTKDTKTTLLVSLLLTLNIFHIFFKYFYCWIWSFVYFLVICLFCFRKNGPGKNAPPGKLPHEKLPPWKLLLLHPRKNAPKKISLRKNVPRRISLLVFRCWHCLTVVLLSLSLPPSLLGKVFQRCLSVKHPAQLVTHGKTVWVPKSVLYKMIFRRDVISNE